MVTTTYTFSIKDIVNNPDTPTISISNKPTISPTISPIDLPDIPINISKEELQKRFVLDIMKDGNASDIHIEDDNVYTTFSKKAFEDVDYTIPNYMTSLKNIETSLEKSIGKGIDFPGLIKNSTDPETGTKIMKTKEIFFESGANEKSVCNIDKIPVPGVYIAKRVSTPAATLDSASKGSDPGKFFPSHDLPLLPIVGLPLPQPKVREIVFDPNFCKRFGFPKDFTWKTSNIPNTGDQFNVSFTCDGINGEISGIVEWNRDYPASPFYVLGNKEKNKKINGLCKKLAQQQQQLEDDFELIFKLLLMKELGDVMQVFMYYAYAMINRY